MSKSIISEGKTRQEAIDKGLKELKASKDMVTIKDVADEGKRSFYSILAPRVVKVELTIKEGVSKKEDRPEKKTEKKERRPFNENMEEIEAAEIAIKTFLGKFLKEDVSYEVGINEFKIEVVLSGENINYLIGYRGETINNLQVLLGAIANKGASSKIRLFLDVGGYKEKREKTLEDLAEKIAKTVMRTGKSITLEPMTAYERKIIHSKLQENNKIATFSKGEEPYRKIVVGLNK
ncbi:MAG: Jag N-terminal domain-containing protein [Oscillospiraceae bacterium]|nr:Jag N-terminal domain-containing protein [Oscillospiraceae bacterium]